MQLTDILIQLEISISDSWLKVAISIKTQQKLLSVLAFELIVKKLLLFNVSSLIYV